MPVTDASSMAAIQTGRPPITCILVDSDEATLESLASVLHDAGFVVVGSANSGAEGLRLLDLHQPDVAVVDLHLPDMTGIDLAREAVAVAPLTALVLHAASIAKTMPAVAIAAGFSGIVLKAVSPLDLSDAIRTACAGDFYLDPALGDRPSMPEL
jgi:DNA-binding NarL/FixJ family response regulator